MIAPKSLVLTLSAILAALVGFLAASCGAGNGAEEAGPVPAAPTETQAGEEEVVVTGTTEETDPSGSGSEEAAERVVLQVWFHQGESLFVTTRSVGKTPRVGSAAIEALLAGPGPVEGSVSVGTQIPAGTKLLGLVIEDGIATVDLSSEFESGGGSLSMTMRLAQVVYTLTQFPTVDGVLFRLDGRPVDVFSGEGIVLDHPVERSDYRDLLPVILVETPNPGDRVASTVRVAGSANVFEANVTVVVLDRDGNELARTFTTATCGSGCRGRYSVDLAYEVSSRQPGVILVHDDDAAGTGSPPHQVRIPVVLTPGG